ncbi:Major facilitator superfamily domain general substrate transporter [Penicillium longicatenatum]|uniref:Major facilitator superfamily domain general substrate transporter n=1 Tax=Penicillium longicatenatum TaxID=1561947 RepID=UPI0025472130|nr:Major facilitator superfamily domain general substrate transporter [Penicillium longicatenatum]KAJ5644202.1 Major facilitator superfamily domain general substrate transporter [Penicillium longicatenatum]
MNDNQENLTAVGYRWRSAKWFILSTIAIALFAETFLYGFLVPILGYMIQNRLHIDPSQTQKLTSTILGLHGALAVLSGPIIGHFADGSRNKKGALLWSLGFCIIGTGIVAGARSVPLLLIGRAMQGIAGSAVWIVGFATVGETVSPDNMGSAMGLMMSFANSGTVSGPALSGLLLEATSYWITWSIPVIVLTIDLLARVIMIEPPSACKKNGDVAETTNLLSSGQHERNPSDVGAFWRIMLCDGRVLTCLLITMTSTIVTTSLDATLPLHVQEKFGWGPSCAGLLFSGLVIPGLIVGPIAGWVRDRVGARVPIVLGSILQSALLGLMGIAGSDAVPWASVRTGGKSMYIASIIGIGAVRPFVSGLAPVELTAAAKSRQEKSPGIFGLQGGISRVFSMLDVAASLGSMIGPILGGSLRALVGYEYMSWAWSTSLDTFYSHY